MSGRRQAKKSSGQEPLQAPHDPKKLGQTHVLTHRPSIEPLGELSRIAIGSSRMVMPLSTSLRMQSSELSRQEAQLRLESIPFYDLPDVSVKEGAYVPEALFGEDGKVNFSNMLEWLEALGWPFEKAADIWVASNLGWEVTIDELTGAVSMISHDGKKKLHLSPNGKHPKKMRETFTRYGVPEKAEELTEFLLATDKDLEQGPFKDTYFSFTVTRAAEYKSCPIGNPHREHDNTDDTICPGLTPREAARIRAAQHQQAQEKRAAMALAEQTTLTPEAPLHTSTNQSPVIEERHFLARHSTKAQLSYVSRAIMERVHQDGTLSYKCVACDFSADHPYSIRGHFQVHVKDGTADRTTNRDRANTVHNPNDDYSVPKYQPREMTIEKLRDFIKEMGTDDVDALAEAILKFQHHDPSGYSTREPQSDAEILDRIRRLVDQGTYADLRQQIEELLDENQLLYMELETRASDGSQTQLLIDQANIRAEAAEAFAREQEAKCQEASDKAARLLETISTFHQLTGELIPSEIDKG